jgi:hypothetical protein
MVIQPIVPTTCKEDWSCTEWSECNKGYHVRSCTDMNSCDSQNLESWEFEKCTVISNETNLNPLSGFMNININPLSDLMNMNVESQVGLVIITLFLILAVLFFRGSSKYSTTTKGILKQDNKKNS